MNVRIDLGDYEKRVCKDICKYHSYMESIEFGNKDPNYKWDYLFHSKCSNDCPFEAMMRLLREEHDQNIELNLEMLEV